MNSETKTILRRMLNDGEPISEMMAVTRLTRTDIMQFSSKEEMRRAEEKVAARKRRMADTGTFMRTTSITDGFDPSPKPAWGLGYAPFRQTGPKPPREKSMFEGGDFASTIDKLVGGNDR